MKIIILMLLMWLPGSALANPVPQQNPFSKPVMTQNRVSSALVANPVGASQSLPVVRATLVGGKAPLILIDDAVVAVGQTVAGFKLIAVREGVAVFTKDDQISEVRVNNDTQSKTPKENSDVE